MKTLSNQMLLSIITVVSFSWLLGAGASDPDPMRDFCVAVNDTDTPIFINGKVCKDPETVTADDFRYVGGLHERQEITSPLGSKVTTVFDGQFPGLNSLGVSLSRLDFAPQGLNPPHEHPRASETLVLLEGELYAGFITANPSDPNDKPRLFAKILHAGDVFVFPRGLIHFQYNVGKTHAVAIVSFNSQNPGVVTVARALFGSEPLVYPEVLGKSFQFDDDFAQRLQSLNWMGNN